MKSNQLNSSEQPPAMSVSNSRNNLCLGHDPNAAAVCGAHGRWHQLSAALRAVLVCGKNGQPCLGKGTGGIAGEKCPSILDVPT